MHQLLFKNRFNALVFVAIILFSVRILVGTDAEGGALETATSRLGNEEQNPVANPGEAQPAPPLATTEFTPDEELVDEAFYDDPAEPTEESGTEEFTGMDTGEF